LGVFYHFCDVVWDWIRMDIIGCAVFYASWGWLKRKLTFFFGLGFGRGF